MHKHIHARKHTRHHGKLPPNRYRSQQYESVKAKVQHDTALIIATAQALLVLTDTTH